MLYLGGCWEFWSLSEDSPAPPVMTGWRDDTDWLAAAAAEDVTPVVDAVWEFSAPAAPPPPEPLLADDVATVADEACEWTVVADE